MNNVPNLDASKPIKIHAITGGYQVEVSDVRAASYGARARKPLPDGFVTREADRKLVIGRLHAPTAFSHEEAASLAHQIGRYMLGFGDLVFAYTDAPDGFWEAGS